MPRVETIVPPSHAALLQVPPQMTAREILLAPDEITLDPAMSAARPGPPPDDEAARIQRLADSMREVGQIDAVIVERRGEDHVLLSGHRRLAAARLLGTTNQPFWLRCSVVAPEPEAYHHAFKLAIHANLKRRGLSPLQLAHLFAHLRKLYSWKGTKEVAAYVGCSRAQVSQHDKLLQRPEGMPEETYAGLLRKLSAGRLGADAAFFALTHVEPAKAKKVTARAEALAVQEAVAKAGKSAPASPSASNARQSASQKVSPAAKLTALATNTSAAQQKAFRQSVADQKRKHKERIAKAKAEARVEKKHLQQAAQEQKAVKKDSALQRTTSTLYGLFEKLSSAAYPDPMRNFISMLSVWWCGDATDKEVVLHWTQVAQLVEQQLERTAKHPAVKKTGNYGS